MAVSLSASADPCIPLWNANRSWYDPSATGRTLPARYLPAPEIGPYERPPPTGNLGSSDGSGIELRDRPSLHGRRGGAFHHGALQWTQRRLGARPARRYRSSNKPLFDNVDDRGGRLSETSPCQQLRRHFKNSADRRHLDTTDDGLCPNCPVPTGKRPVRAGVTQSDLLQNFHSLHAAGAQSERATEGAIGRALRSRGIAGQPKLTATLRRLRSAPPTRPKPASIIAQLAGSGTSPIANGCE